ncbi:MAG: TetR/AcrR family transcriptional regulator [Alphaproteobacteria bacterium]|jgi:TetR/AcrR family transcriptional repressor of nem operon|nr:TetR/AcrR family transcriptional regulator [Alphaproteobacteria bacterium]
MKVSRDQLAENHRQILDAASRLFRERGIDGVTVAQIMRAAGLTHGAFYGHFKSKEALVAQACAHALQRDGIDDLARYVAGYLTPRHRDEQADGCVFAALGAEVVRGTPEARKVLTLAAERQIERLAAIAPGRTQADRRRAAITTWSAMIGAMILARLVDDGALSAEILGATEAGLRGFSRTG